MNERNEAALVVPAAPERAEELPPGDDPRAPAVGRWFWVTGENLEGKARRWFGCVTHVGSNYAEIHAPGGSYERIHEDEFYDRCEREPDARSVIDRHVAEHQGEVKALLEEVKALSVKLGIPLDRALLPKSEVGALAVRGAGGADMGAYKKALVKAKEKTLPDLFEKIRRASDSLATWLSADLIPLKANAEALKPAIEAIEDRIFSVELYAGLVEEVEEIADGQAASLDEPIHLMQRRAYCDEESLARYETGGMEFKDIGAFDRWLARPENRDRLLPFPRCIVAFRVRRKEKEREWANLREFIQMIESGKADKFTFLYLRNGQRLYRLSTEIDFDEKLFPDMDEHLLRGEEKLYAKIWSSDRVDKIISEHEYRAMIEEEEAHAAKVAKMPEKDRWMHANHFPDSRGYHPFTRESVHFDDIRKHVEDEMKKHNRLVLVLQGLLDRSPVFHPHPPWPVWTEEGFRKAVRLVYDDTRALVAGARPDFEAYRTRCNADLREGSITVGQEEAWEIREAVRENERMDRDYRHKRSDYRPTRYRPYGDPGPGTLARVAKWSPKKKTCTYEWTRERRTSAYSDESRVGCFLSVSASRVLSVEGYKPGDFRQFFSDPRTRADYLEWAPLLLVAEEFCAGNRKPPEPLPVPARERSEEGARRYRKKKQRRALIGKAVRLLRMIHTEGGQRHDKGTLWRVTRGRGDYFDLTGIAESGVEEGLQGSGAEGGRRFVMSVHSRSFEVDVSIPAAPKEER